VAEAAAGVTVVVAAVVAEAEAGATK